MVNKQKITGRANSMPAGIAIGAIVSVLLTVLLSMLLSKLVDSGRIAWENIGYGIMIQTILASFIGSAVAFSRIKRQRLCVHMMSGCIYYGALFAAATLFFGGHYEGMGVTALVVLAGCGSAFLLGAHGGQPIKKRNKKMRYC